MKFKCLVSVVISAVISTASFATAQQPAKKSPDWICVWAW